MDIIITLVVGAIVIWVLERAAGGEDHDHPVVHVLVPIVAVATVAIAVYFGWDELKALFGF